jgi:thiazole synthase
VLLNTGVALADDPPAMARAMRLGLEAGRTAYLAGRMAARPLAGSPSSPMAGRIE